MSALQQTAVLGVAMLASCARGGGQERPPDAATEAWDAASDEGTAVDARSSALPGLDREMARILATWRVPGAAVAVAKDGRLVVASGYGVVEEGRAQPIQPESLFRIASVTKPIIAVTALRLVERGLLSLDDHPFTILSALAPPAGATPDPRLAQITIRHLLIHAGGWDRARSFDPVARPWTAAQSVGLPPPGGCEAMIRYMLGQPLDFDPGTTHAYSNFGYCVLGKVIEHVTGRPLEEHVREDVLAPLGITRMRLGHTRPEERAAGEVRYHDFLGAPLARSVFPEITAAVPRPYGGFYLEAFEGNGGWLASVIDLVRFAVAVDGHRGSPLLTSAAVAMMTARPELPLWAGQATYYAMGWGVKPIGKDANWWHFGFVEGTTSMLVRAANGVVWAILFNGRPQDGVAFEKDMDAVMWKLTNAVTEWPTLDLFPPGM